MRPLKYSINITLDGCADHNAIVPYEELHRHSMNVIAEADALIFGRVIYRMMEGAWRNPSPQMPDWTLPFAKTISAAKKYVVSGTLTDKDVDWNAELVHCDLETFVRKLKEQPGGSLYTGGLTLPRALAAMDLIDDYEFTVHPRIAGHGPTLFAGLPAGLDLELVERFEFATGAVVLRYKPRR